MDGDESKVEKMKSLLSWAAHLGITDSSSSPPSPTPLGHSIFVSDFPDAGGRGLAAARDLRQGEMILRVPRSALMTSDSVLLGDEKLAACVKRHPHLSATQILTACLLAEVGKGSGSRWYPYLIELPRSYSTLAYFSPFEIQALQVEDAMWVAEKAVLKAKSEWKETILVMQEMELRPQLLTFRSWLWSSATISSRTLHIAWDSAGCLCPIGDLFNYAAPEEEFGSEDLESMPESLHSNVSSLLNFKDKTEKLDHEELGSCFMRLTDGGYDENTDSYCFYARKRYKKGEQVLLSYGTYTNLELLEHYGFLLNNNPNNKAYTHLTPDIYMSTSWSRDSLYIQFDGSPSFALLCSLRLWATPTNLRRTLGRQAYTGSLLSNENETSVMKWMVEHCHDALGEMPTSAEEDEVLLAIIDKMLDGFPCTGLQSCEGEVGGFFLASGLEMESMFGQPLTIKVRRSLQRWKLAVQWRLNHKRMLLSSISYCNKIISTLSS